jgi:hypothetical protein
MGKDAGGPVNPAGLSVIDRDHVALVAHFAAHGYPPPHPFTCFFRSQGEIAASIATAEDVVVPIIIRKQTGEIVDGIIRCERLCSQGAPWRDVPRRVVDLPTDEDVAKCIAKSIDRRHLDQSQLAMHLVQLGLAEPMQGKKDLRENYRKLVSAKYLQFARTVADPTKGT